MLKKFLIVVLLVCFFISNSYASETLYFGVPSKNSGISMLDAWEPVVKEIRALSNLSIKLVIVKDHKDLIQKMEEGVIDFGYFSPVPYLIARNTIDCEPLVMRVLYGSSYYQSGIIVRKDSKIEKISDLKGKKIALTAYADSTSGYFVPLVMLEEHNIDLNNDIEKVIHTGKHINVLKAVSFGEIDAGAIKLYILKDKVNQKFKEDIKVIAYSPFLPGSPIVIDSNLDQSKKDKIKEAFIKISLYKSGREALKLLNFDGFVPTHDALYRSLDEYLDKVDYQY